MLENNHARLVHRLKKRSPTSYNPPTPTDDDPGPILTTPDPAQPSSPPTPTPTPDPQPPAQQPTPSAVPSQPSQPPTDPQNTASSSSQPSTPTANDAPTNPSQQSSSSSSATPTVNPNTNTPGTTPPTASQRTTSPSPLGPVVPSDPTNTVLKPTLHLTSPSSSPSAISDAATAGTGTNHTGTIIGVVVAVIGGLIAVFFLSTYFMRRRARRNEDDFSAEAFKRQSMVLPDEHGNNPRPPSMVEQHMNAGPATFGGAPIYGDRSFHGGGQSYDPGQIVTMPPQAWSPDGSTPHSSQPFFNPMGDTPLGSPVTPGPYDSFYNAQGQLVRQPSSGANVMMNHPYAAAPVMLERQASNGAGAMLNRQPSSGPMAAYSPTPSPGPAAAFNRQPSPGPVAMFARQPSPGPAAMMNRQPSPGPGVVLNRQPSLGANSAMNQSPFGSDAIVDYEHSPISPPAAAYVTRQAPATESQYNPMNDAHYVDLNRSSVSPFQAAQYEEISNRLETSPPQPLPTPEVAAFAEEALTNHAPIATNVSEPRPLNVPSAKPAVQDPTRAVSALDEDELPPPSPAYSSKSRIDSTPPTLPEIHLPERSFSPVTMDFPIAPSSVHPSPLSAAFTLPSPSVENHFPAPANPDTPTVPGMRPVKQEVPTKRPDTVYTLYDDEDAYAGI